ncbi:MAG: divergent PAP2 family protein [Clostridiales bacterium]|nr:divergent PAP2 family protein [Clostridiales bacterium]
MHFDFWRFVNSPVIITAFISWFIAQFLKIFTSYKEEKKIKLSRFFNSSGMPSSHTSVIISATTTIGILYGFENPLFSLAIIFSFIVMYDAAGVRYETGKQATLINFLVEEIKSHKISEVFHVEKLKELIGHKPIEVLAGAVLGIAVSVGYCLLVIK